MGTTAKWMLCMWVPVLTLAAGCLEKPPRLAPGDRFPGDAVRDNETAGGEGVVPGEPADSLQPDGDAHGPDLWDMEGAPEDDCRGGPPCPPDGDTHVPDLWDMEGAPEDDCRGGPPCPPDGDADVPPVEPGGPVLVPGIFAGRLAGGEFTLVPVGPGGFEGGVTMTGGKWTLRTSIAAPGANM